MSENYLQYLIPLEAPDILPKPARDRAPEPSAARAAAPEAKPADLAPLLQRLEHQGAALQAAEKQIQRMSQEMQELGAKLAELQEELDDRPRFPRLGLGTALLVPFFGLSLNTALHFAFYELFLHLGEIGSPWANLAAETLLGFQLATESSPHAYFYWLVIELLASSSIVIASIGFVLWRLRRISEEEAS